MAARRRHLMQSFRFTLTASGSEQCVLTCEVVDGILRVTSRDLVTSSGIPIIKGRTSPYHRPHVKIHHPANPSPKCPTGNQKPTHLSTTTGHLPWSPTGVARFIRHISVHVSVQNRIFTVYIHGDLVSTIRFCSITHMFSHTSWLFHVFSSAEVLLFTCT